MASPYQNISDTGFDTPIMPVDYSFLNTTLGRIGEDYKQGVSTVKNLYNSVLNAPISNGENQEVRSRYITSVEKGLQSLAKSDLSLPGNVEQASKLFAPFWEDDDILQDISKTKQVQGEFQKAESARTSTDKEIRSTYDPRIETYIGIPIVNLKEAKRGDGSIAKVEINKFIPFRDVKKAADQALKDSGKTIVHTYPNNQGYLVKTTNGEISYKSYKSFIEDVLDDSYNEQFRVIGTVNKYHKTRNLMDMGFTKEEAEQKLGTETFEQAASDYREKIKSYSLNNLYVTSQMQEIVKSIPVAKDGKQYPTPEQTEALGELARASADYESKLRKAQTEGYEFLDARKAPETLADLINHYENYSAKLEREKVINGWATRNAAMESIEYSEDHAFADAQSRKLQAARDAEDIRYHNMVDALGWANKNQNWMIAMLNNGLDKNGNKKPIEEEGTVLALSTDLAQHVDKITLYNNEQKKNIGYVNSGLWHPKGLSSTLSSLPGISGDDIANLNTWMLNNTENKANSITPEMISSFANIYNGLLSEGIAPPKLDIPALSKHPEQLKDILTKSVLEHATKYADFNLKNGDGVTASKISATIDKIEHGLRAYKANNTDLQKNLHNIIQSEKYKKNPLIVDRGGVNDIITAEDIAMDLPKEIVARAANGSTVTLSANTIGRSYLAGDFSYGNGPTENTVLLKLGKVEYVIPGMYSELTPFHDLEKKYGKSKDLKKEYTKLLEKAIPRGRELVEKTGIEGQVIGYGFNKGEHGVDLIKETAQIGNQEGAFLNPQMSEAAAQEDLAAFMRLAGSEESIKKNLAEFKISNIGTKGNQVAIVTLSNATDKANETNPDRAQLYGKTLYINLKEGALGENLQKVMRSIEVPTTMYPEFDRGITLRQSEGDRAVGYYWSIRPDRTDGKTKPTMATVSMNRMVANPETGNFESKLVEETYPLNKYTIDHLVKMIDEERPKHWNQNIVNRKKYQSKFNKDNAPTLDQVKQQYGIK